MTRIVRSDRPRAARVLVSGLLQRTLGVLEGRGDWCTRCGQPGHVAASCKLPIPAAGQPSLDRPVTLG